MNSARLICHPRPRPQRSSCDVPCTLTHIYFVIPADFSAQTTCRQTCSTSGQPRARTRNQLTASPNSPPILVHRLLPHKSLLLVLRRRRVNLQHIIELSVSRMQGNRPSCARGLRPFINRNDGQVIYSPSPSKREGSSRLTAAREQSARAITSPGARASFGPSALIFSFPHTSLSTYPSTT